jgi:hypothetical protein
MCCYLSVLLIPLILTRRHREKSKPFFDQKPLIEIEKVIILPKLQKQGKKYL